jgi:Iron-containing redox enzyme
MTPPFAPDICATCTPGRHVAPVPGRARDLYFSLERDPAAAADAGRHFLHEQIAAVRELAADLPPDLHRMPGWLTERARAVGLEYREYLAGRRNGAQRRYFGNQAHALYFLRGVAPTKLVDGAWLYGTLRHWDKPEFRSLIKTYLEELGDGVPGQNHVALYRGLLASHGCEQWEHLPDQHFVQGAIQLALACNAEHFLPEIIGYNLGYEQLPLHLLISAYELNELGIDPYYFTLHVTVDNAGTGHAHKAVQALAELMPQVGDRAAFHARVLDGYRLNEAGASAASVIAGFSLQDELLRILASRAMVGANLHSDYCRVGGRSVNDWLASPARIPEFLAALQESGWVARGEEPEHSRFWRLVSGARAEMFGVFNAYELQVLRDWIVEAPGEPPRRTRVSSHRARQRALDNLGERARRGQYPQRGLVRRHASVGDDAGENELRLLEQRVAAAASKAEAMELLRGLLAPGLHHTPAGLMATRMVSRLLDA